MMEATILNKFIDTEPCTDSTMQEHVLALPGGRLSPVEKKYAIEHLAECPSCRYMLEIWQEIGARTGGAREDDTDTGCPWTNIPIVIAGEGLSAAGTSLANTPRMYVLSGKSMAALEYTVPLKDKEAILRIIMTGNTLRVEIDDADESERFYCIRKDNFEIASPLNGRVTFENLACDDILISRGMTDFFRIKLMSEQGPGSKG